MLAATCRLADYSARYSNQQWSLYGDDADSFSIDRGQIHAFRPLDYETKSSHRLIVEYKAWNGSALAMYAYTEVHIPVLDVNDLSPKFASSNAELLVSESASHGYRLYKAEALDSDLDGREALLYSLIGHSSHFEIDPSSGWITLVKPLDFESQQLHSLNIEVRDTEEHRGAQQLQIHVLDQNDNAPVWKAGLEDSEEKLFDEVHVKENSEVPEQGKEIYLLQASDIDGDTKQLEYRLIAKSVRAEFSLLSNGSFRVLRPLDREKVASYTFEFEVSDGLHVSQNRFKLNVIVDDENDNAPVCAKSYLYLNVSESVPVSSELVTLEARDLDEMDLGRLQFDLSDGDGSLVSVNSGTGQVRLKEALDFEAQSWHSFRFDVRDTAQKSCSIALFIRVQDANDNSPEFDIVDANSVSEDARVGTVAGIVHAVDRDWGDNSRLVYSIKQANNASFSIDSNSGLLKVSRALDRETQAQHSLIVQVTDASEKGHTVSTTVTIVLLDVNDSPPQFVDSTKLSVTVPESLPEGSPLTTLKAISLDEGANAHISYRLVTDQPEFSLNSSTGELILLKSLDHEAQKEYFLTVEAQDGGTPPLKRTAVVTINVQDENDNAPQFVNKRALPFVDTLLSQPTKNQSRTSIVMLHMTKLARNGEPSCYDFLVIEGSKPGTQAGQISATDADSGVNGKASYTFADAPSSWQERDDFLVDQSEPIQFLSSVETASLFSLNENSGRLTLNFQPDREKQAKYWFVVKVQDQAMQLQQRLSNLACVRVRIQDVNDEVPTFEQDSYTFHLTVNRESKVVGIRDANGILMQPTISPEGQLLLGKMRITDRDGHPNAGPFNCVLSHAPSKSPNSLPSFSGSRWKSLKDDKEAPLFQIKNGSFSNLNEQEGECLAFASLTLQVRFQIESSCF
ncbi:Protocadherin Fat 4 [Cichlidogyrus casuarinus]|uniref:Protocadherin Fat 4 n=1 Tax=Cichlidogyrus casuarinus TaxID=1844966 RepID=A0ABD2QNK5_9PLAT